MALILDTHTPANTYNFSAFFIDNEGGSNTQIVQGLGQAVMATFKQFASDAIAHQVNKLIKGVTLPSTEITMKPYDMGYMTYPVPDQVKISDIRLDLVEDDLGYTSTYFMDWMLEIARNVGGNSGGALGVLKSIKDTAQASAGTMTALAQDPTFGNMNFGLLEKTSKTLVVVKTRPSLTRAVVDIILDQSRALTDKVDPTKISSDLLAGVGELVSGIFSQVGIEGIPYEIHMFPQVIPTAITPAKLDKVDSAFRDFSVSLTRVPTITGALGNSDKNLTVKSRIMATVAYAKASSTIDAGASIALNLGTLGSTVVNKTLSVQDTFKKLSKQPR